MDLLTPANVIRQQQSDLKVLEYTEITKDILPFVNKHINEAAQNTGTTSVTVPISFCKYADYETMCCLLHLLEIAGYDTSHDVNSLAYFMEQMKDECAILSLNIAWT